MTDDERDVFRAALTEGCAAIGVLMDAGQVEMCRRYAELLLETNAHTNLTRITEPAAIAVKHFVDSLTVLSAVPDLPRGATLADVGTGAGFPGLALKIARPDLRVTLLDSLRKRLTFLAEVSDALGLTDVTLVHARAEDAGHAPAHRDASDLVTARAVAALPTLLEWCGPLVIPGGRFVALKTDSVDDELPASARIAQALQLRLTADVPVTLPLVPGEDTPGARRLLVYAKTAATPARYPRHPASRS